MNEEKLVFIAVCLRWQPPGLSACPKWPTLTARSARCGAQAGWKPQPAPKGEQPVLQIVANTFQDRITLYRNMSGDSLHRRGYREAMHKAALNESTAAGVLLWLGWDELCDAVERPVLVDPMCGSGTFLVEAALIATRCASPLVLAPFAFPMYQPFYSQNTIRTLRVSKLSLQS